MFHLVSNVVAAESASQDTVKNAVNSFRNLGVLELYTLDGIRQLGLGHVYKIEEKLDSFIEELSSFHLATVCHFIEQR